MTIAEIYKSTAAAYGRPFVDDQCNAWNSGLQGFSAREVQAAVEQWQRNTREDYDGRTLGSKLPQPSDLRAICQRQRDQESAQRTGDFVSCNGCEEGWRRMFTGQTVKRNPVDPKVGAVRMCRCRVKFLCTALGCEEAELQEVIRKRDEQRAKRK